MNVLRLGIFLLAAAGAAPRLAAVTFTVTNTNDSGPGSLRQAIIDANGNFSNDDIVFSIAGSGVQTIHLASPLPAITEPVILNGYSQPGSSPNTNPVGQGLNTVLMISIDGSASTFGSCITTNAGNFDVFAMEISGLNIYGCIPAGIFAGPGSDGLVISGNFIGTDPTGTVRASEQDNAIAIVNAPGVEIGGAIPFSRNLLSGSNDSNILVNNGPNAVIRGNLIGTNAAGDAAIAPELEFGRGIEVLPGANVTIGGPVVSHRNVISGHGGVGIETTPTSDLRTIEGNFIGTDVTGTRPLGNRTGIQSTTSGTVIRDNVIGANADFGIVAGGVGVIVLGNFIGTDETGTLDLGNGASGISTGGDSWIIGGIAPGEGNVIAYNGQTAAFSGISVGGLATTIRGNRFFGNHPLGIDLFEASAGVTRNDPGDADTGPNGLQNFPLILSVSPGASTTHIEGILNSTASTTFDVDLYAAPVCQSPPQGFLQGETFLGTLPVTTDGAGNASFQIDVPQVLEAGQRVTATATDPAGNTSEFSQGLLFSMDPESGPAGGGTETTLHGMLFEMGATVMVGGVPATNVLVQGSTSILATMPPLPAGSVNDVAVVNPSGTSGIVESAWIADFLDVPAADSFHLFVIELVSRRITAGVGGGNYGKTQPTLRQQMAVFLLKAKHGLCYTPPPCKGVFSDVPCPSLFADWIEALADEGITSGCGGGLYCPQTPVRRDQMAVFLLKAFYGSDHVPPPCTGVFDDVDCPSPFADWIEQLAAEQITSGCGGDNYCPFSPNTRGQMAVFIVKTFFEP